MSGIENDATSSENVGEDQDAATPFTDSYDIATKRFQDMVDEHVSSCTISIKRN